jgi:hypothetical protein
VGAEQARQVRGIHDPFSKRAGLAQNRAQLLHGAEPQRRQQAAAHPRACIGC